MHSASTVHAMSTGLLFWRAFYRPCDIMVSTSGGNQFGGHNLKLLSLLHERLLNVVYIGALYQVATASPNCRYGGLSSSLLTLHLLSPSHPTHPMFCWCSLASIIHQPLTRLVICEASYSQQCVHRRHCRFS